MRRQGHLIGAMCAIVLAIAGLAGCGNAGGKHIGTIVVPEQPANLAWGDSDYQTLYITATTSVYRLRLKARGFVPYLAH